MEKKKSSKTAVIRINNNQYLVQEGREILIDPIKEKNVKPEVLLIVTGEKVKIGTPLLKDARVKVKLLGEEKGKKIDVYKFKAKSRYRRKMGFRPNYQRLLVEKIS